MGLAPFHWSKCVWLLINALDENKKEIPIRNNTWANNSRLILLINKSKHDEGSRSWGTHTRVLISIHSNTLKPSHPKQPIATCQVYIILNSKWNGNTWSNEHEFVFNLGTMEIQILQPRGFQWNQSWIPLNLGSSLPPP